MNRLVHHLSVAVMAIAPFVMATTASAEYPERPIKIVVPFGPGGTTDTTARIFQQAISENDLLTQPIAVVNVTGGAVGSVGARSVMNAKPDGYTFLILHIAMMSGHAAGTLDYSYNDFEPVAGTTDFCHVAVVSEDSPYNSLEELLTAAKDEPDSLIYGANLGGNLHMTGLMMEDSMPGAKFRIVQIGGEANNITALKGNIINATTLSTGTYSKFKEEGLRALAAFAPEREPDLPDVPTAAEEGYDISFCVQHWWFAPKGTPKDRIDAFAAVLKNAMDVPDLQNRFKERSTLLTYDTGPSFKTKLDETYDWIAPIAQRAKKK